MPANGKEWEFKYLLALPTGTNSLPKILMFSSFFFIWNKLPNVFADVSFFVVCCVIQAVGWVAYVCTDHLVLDGEAPMSLESLDMSVAHSQSQEGSQ